MDAKKFGMFLLEQRKALGLTQAQLAERIHVTDKAVSRWERGVGLPDIHLLEPLADAREVSVLELIRAEKVQENLLPVTDAENLVSETIALASEQTDAMMKERQRKPLLFYVTTILSCIGLYIIFRAMGKEEPDAILCLIGFLMAIASPIYLYILATNYYIFWKSRAMSNYRNARYQ